MQTKRLGAVEGISPVAICSKNNLSNSYLAVYVKGNVLFGGRKTIIYRLDNVSHPYRVLKNEGPISLDYMRFSASGNLLAAACNDSLYPVSGFIYDHDRDHPKMKMFHSGERWIAGVPGRHYGSGLFAMNPNDSLIVMAPTLSGKLTFLDVRDLNQLRVVGTWTPSGTQFHTASLSWSPNGKTLAYQGCFHKEGDKHRHIYLVDIDFANPPSFDFNGIGSLTFKSRYEEEERVDMTFSPDSRLLALGSDRKASDKLKLFDVAARKLVFESEPINTTTISLSFSPNGKFLFSGDKDGCVRIWQVEDGSQLSLLEIIRFQGEIYQVCIADQDKQLLVAYNDGKMVAVDQVFLPGEMVD